MRIAANLLSPFVLFAVFATAPLTSEAAQFVSERSSRHGAWSAHLFRNLNGNRLFCALESRDGGTEFRVNHYKVSGETFLEVYNPDWTLMKGNVRFTLDFQLGNENYQAVLAGRSWGDGYTHDFTDVKHYHAVMGLISEARSFEVRNSNGVAIAQFSGNGSRAAAQSYASCLES